MIAFEISLSYTFVGARIQAHLHAQIWALWSFGRQTNWATHIYLINILCSKNDEANIFYLQTMPADCWLLKLGSTCWRCLLLS